VKNLKILFIASIFITSTISCKFVINQPVVDLLVNIPTEVDANLSEKTFGHLPQNVRNFLATLPPENRNPNIDSQLLFGEEVSILEEVGPEGDFVKVEAIGQGFENKKVIGYINKTQIFSIPNAIVCNQKAKIYSLEEPAKEIMQLSLGTKLTIIRKLDVSWYQIILPDGSYAKINSNDINSYEYLSGLTEKELRTNIINCAKNFLRYSYCWGGCSCNKVDCSGLTRLAYLCSNLTLPRNAIDQYLACKKLENGSQLKPADLIFYARADKPKRVFHVMMYLGENALIECGCPFGVRILTGEAKFGKTIETINGEEILNNEICKNLVIYFGTFINK